MVGELVEVTVLGKGRESTRSKALGSHSGLLSPLLSLTGEKKDFEGKKKICKTLLMYIFSSSGLESLEESLLQDQGTGCISRDTCTWKQAIFISSEMGPQGGTDRNSEGVEINLQQS